MLVRHAWLSGLLRREMKRGVGNRMVNGVIFNVFHLTDTGSNFLADPSEIFLPAVGSQKSSKSNVREDKSDKPKTTRKGMGSQALSTIRRLMSSSDQWFTVNSSSSYHFPGVFHSPFPQRMGFCPDITQLPSHEKSDPDFIFTDIQLGKGKARNQREIVMNIDSQEEAVLYRIVPCGGVKLCPHYGEDCQYVVSTRETKRCSVHSAEDLQRSSPCPVEFVYIKPKEPADNRRWITGIVRGGELTADNLHNHPLHGNVKITAKVDSDIRRAVIENPHLKTQDIVTGTYPKAAMTCKVVAFSVHVFLMYVHRYWDGLHAWSS